MKKHFLLGISLLLLFNVAAQEEVYFFEDTHVYKTEVLHGLSLQSGLSSYNLLRNGFGPKIFIVPVNISYFHENRLTSTISLNKTVGFVTNLNWIQYSDKETSEFINKYGFTYDVNLAMELEPRWYFRYKTLASQGKGKLNSGPFLSTPISAVIPLSYASSQFKFRNNFSVSAYVSIAGGYRYAVSDNWFLEAKGQVQLFSYIKSPYYWENGFNFLIDSNNFNTIFMLKAAYKL